MLLHPEPLNQAIWWRDAQSSCDPEVMRPKVTSQFADGGAQGAGAPKALPKQLWAPGPPEFLILQDY